MVMDFVDRGREMSELEGLLGAGRPALIRVYGRRRLGKTEILKRLCQRVNGLYLLVDESDSLEQRASLSRQVRDQLGAELRAYPDWDSFFRQVRECGRDVVMIDEAQLFYESDPSFFSRLRHHWDDHLRLRGPSIVLCGSSIGMMQRITARKGAPLFGRLQGDLRVKPFGYSAVRLLYPGLDESERIRRYAVFGGAPYYHNFSVDRSLEEAIRGAFLRQVAPLRDEPENLLRAEVRRLARYVSILREIGKGTHDLRELENKVGVRSGRLSPYLATLRDEMDVLRTEEPVCGVQRRSRYVMSDPFFVFYYRLVFETRRLVEMGLEDDAWAAISAGLDTHFGTCFEEVVREALRALNGREFQGARIAFDRIGRWWNRQGEEIDVVASGDRSIIAGEAKWSPSRMTHGVLDRLETKVDMMERKGARGVRLLLATCGRFPEGLEREARRMGALVLGIDEIRTALDSGSPP